MPETTARLRDLALAAGAILNGSGHDNATYELRGPLWTYPELAEARAASEWLAAGSIIVQQQALKDFRQAMANFFAP